MNEETIFIKGMVCKRCLITVEAELRELGYTPLKLSLGEVSFLTNDTQNHKALQERFSLLGLSIIEDKKVTIAESIKRLVEEVYGGDFDFPERFRFSHFAKQRLQMEYESVSDTFIAIEKKTIEQFSIEYRINKVKEFLVYSNLRLSDIAFKLNFTSVAHLSAQFKQHTGLTPSFFKGVKKEKNNMALSE